MYGFLGCYTCNVAFPIGIMDNLFAVEEHLRALPAYLWDVVTKAICQGLPRHWLLPSLRLAQRWMSGWWSRVFHRIRWIMTSPIWSRVSSRPPTPSYQRWMWTRSYMPTLTHDLWDILVVLVVMNKFDVRDALAKYVNSYLHVGVNFYWTLYQALFGCICIQINPHVLKWIEVELN